MVGVRDHAVSSVRCSIWPVLSPIDSGCTPMTNLYLTVLDRVGVRPDAIGDSTGRIEHLTDVSA